jgi:hypothetical protein
LGRLCCKTRLLFVTEPDLSVGHPMALSAERL